MWTTDEIAESVSGGLERAERALAVEQAVYGLEALDEVELHGLVAAALEGAGWGVLREVPYPTPPSRLARRAQRDRCDIVLTPGPGQRVKDAVALAKEADLAEGTLFAATGPATPDPHVIEPAQALWIEVKTLGQFVYREGVPTGNRAYASELVRGPALDAKKLAMDPGIARGMAIIVLFAASEEIVRHDLEIAIHRMLDAGAPLRGFALRLFGVPDRIGNHVCASIALDVACAGLSA